MNGKTKKLTSMRKMNHFINVNRERNLLLHALKGGRRNLGKVSRSAPKFGSVIYGN